MEIGIDAIIQYFSSLPLGLSQQQWRVVIGPDYLAAFFMALVLI